MGKRKKREDLGFAVYEKHYSLGEVLERNRHRKRESDTWDIDLFAAENVNKELERVRELIDRYSEGWSIVTPEAFRRYMRTTHITDAGVAQQMIDHVLELNRLVILNNDPNSISISNDYDFDEKKYKTGKQPWDDRQGDDLAECAAALAYEQLTQIDGLNKKYDDFYIDKSFLMFHAGESDTILLHTERPKAFVISINNVASWDYDIPLIKIKTEQFNKNTFKIIVSARMSCHKVIKISDSGKQRVLRAAVAVV